MNYIDNSPLFDQAPAQKFIPKGSAITIYVLGGIALTACAWVVYQQIEITKEKKSKENAGN